MDPSTNLDTTTAALPAARGAFIAVRRVGASVRPGLLQPRRECLRSVLQTRLRLRGRLHPQRGGRPVRLGGLLPSRGSLATHWSPHAHRPSPNSSSAPSPYDYRRVIRISKHDTYMYALQFGEQH